MTSSEQAAASPALERGSLATGDWQQRAARELAAILDAHPGLPAIAWTVGPTGALVGRVSGVASATEILGTFARWQQALGAENIAAPPSPDGEVIHLRASARQASVKITLTANVYTEDTADTTAPTATAPAAVTGRPADGVRPSRESCQPATRTAGPAPELLRPPSKPGGPRPTQAS